MAFTESNAADASTTVDTKPAAEPAPAVSQSPLSSNKKDVKDVKDTKEVKDAKGIQDVKEVKDAKAIKDVKDNAVTRQQVKGGSPVNAPVPAKSQPQPPLDSTTKDKSDKSKSKGGPVVGEDGEKQLAGKGPKPLATVAKENGGDAGNVHTESKAKAKANTSESSKKSNEKDAQEKGTGEKLVKTSGLAADGGNFDATKPGAGKEADRKLNSDSLVSFLVQLRPCCIVYQGDIRNKYLGGMMNNANFFFVPQQASWKKKVSSAKPVVPRNPTSQTQYPPAAKATRSQASRSESRTSYILTRIKESG